MKKALVVYHAKPCADGIAAAWVMQQWLGASAEYVEGRYQSIEDIDFSDREVYLVDFSYPRKFMLEHVLPVAKSVYLLDHHATAIDQLIDIDDDKFDTSWATTRMSGAMIAWNFTQRAMGRKKAPPLLLQHIQDRDLWKFEMPHTREIMAAFFSYKLNPEELTKYMEKSEQGLRRMVAEGATILRVHDQLCRSIIGATKRMVTLQFNCIDGVITFTLPTVNAPPEFASDIGNILAESEPGGIGLTYFDSERSRSFSIRSRKGIDITPIAAAYGGGGHPQASGFKVPRDSPLAKI